MQHSNYNSIDITIQALQWHLDQGIDVALSDQAVSFYKMPKSTFEVEPVPEAKESTAATMRQSSPTASRPAQTSPQSDQALILDAAKIAKAANTLEELHQAIADFDGLSLKRTATNMVFSDGNKGAKIMLIGDAPGADDDRQGKPFVGKSGQLLDKILSFIDLSRQNEDIAKSFYASNILNWRPPGNRTPDPHEIAVSLPFIERHIALINPDILLLAGDIACKTLLNSKSGIMRMRGKWQNYSPLTPHISEGTALPYDGLIKALPILHPAFILKNPSDKAKIWSDMLLLKQERSD